MVKVTSVVVSWTLDSLHRRGRSACAVYYSDKISESLSRVDSFKHESRRRVGVDALKFWKERLVVAFEERGACKPAKYFPIPLTFLSTVFAKILADRLTTSLKSFRSKIINHRLDIRLAYSLDPTIISNKLRITKRKDVGKRERKKNKLKLIEKNTHFRPVLNVLSFSITDLPHWRITTKMNNSSAKRTKNIRSRRGESGRRFEFAVLSPSSVSSVTGYRTTRCTIDSTSGVDSPHRSSTP